VFPGAAERSRETVDGEIADQEFPIPVTFSLPARQMFTVLKNLKNNLIFLAIRK